MLSLTTWSRSAFAASVGLVAVCGFLIVDDELAARKARAELHDFWLPARVMNRELLQAEQAVGAALARFVASPKPSTHDQAELSIARLQNTLTTMQMPQGSPELMSLALASRDEASSWIAHDASAITLAEPLRAQATSVHSERELVSATEARLAELNSGAAQVRASLNHTSTVLRITAVIETMLLLSLLALLMFGLRFRVLRPLVGLREDLERSTRHITHAIRPTGPREISAVAHDAETLRRSLIHEHDSSDQAQQALAQSSPLTIAVRRELDRHDQEVSGVIGYHRPIEGVIAGDWWWAGDDGEGVRAFAIADVSGHGVSAGMLALESRTLVTSALMHGQSPELICSQLANRRMAPGMFFTLFIGILRGRTLTYCSAGHQDAAAVSRHDLLELSTTGPIISELGGNWHLEQVDLAEDAAVLIATDGLLDHAPRASFPRLAQQMWVRSGGQAAECMELLLAQAREQSVQWQDDVTVMIATANR